MKLSEIISSSARVNDFNDELQAYLQKIPVIAKKTNGKKPSLELIEQCIAKLTQKYNLVYMQSIFLTVLDDETTWYSVSIINREKCERIMTIYGITLYELMSKVLLAMYAHVRKESK